MEFFLRALLVPFVLLIVLTLVRWLSWKLYPFIPRGMRAALFTDFHSGELKAPRPVDRGA